MKYGEIWWFNQWNMVIYAGLWWFMLVYGGLWWFLSKYLSNMISNSSWISSFCFGALEHYPDLSGLWPGTIMERSKQMSQRSTSGRGGAEDAMMLPKGLENFQLFFFWQLERGWESFFSWILWETMSSGPCFFKKITGKWDAWGWWPPVMFVG